MEQFVSCLLSGLIRLRIRQLEACDHMPYQMNKYVSNSIMIGLSKKYQDLLCEVIQTYHWISAVSYTAACVCDLAC